MAENAILEPSSGVVFVGPFSEPKVVELRITNPGTGMISYKMKSTRVKRFKMQPGFGYVEAKSEKVVRLTCNPFNAERHLSVRDRFTILLAPVPPQPPKRASQLWKHGSPNEPKSPRRISLPVTYLKEAPKEKKEEKEEKKKEEPKEEKKKREETKDTTTTTEGTTTTDGTTTTEGQTTGQTTEESSDEDEDEEDEEDEEEDEDETED